MSESEVTLDVDYSTDFTIEPSMPECTYQLIIMQNGVIVDETLSEILTFDTNQAAGTIEYELYY